MAEAKKNCIEFKIFHVESMILACIGACRCVDFVDLKWLEILLKFKGPVRNLFVQEAEDLWQRYLDFLLHRILSPNCFDVMKIKKNLQGSLLKKVNYFEEVLTKYL